MVANKVNHILHKSSCGQVDVGLLFWASAYRPRRYATKGNIRVNEIKFYVQGSADEPYIVRFRKSENNLTALCNCPAGQNGMYCKHRFRIMEGSSDNVIGDNLEQIKIVQNWLVGSDVEIAINELREAEKELETAKKKVSSYKKKLARKLLD